MLQGPGIISRICGVKSPKIFATNTLNITVCHHQRCQTYWHPARCHGWSRPRVTRADGQETPENSHGWRPFLNEGWKNDWKQRRFSTTTSSPPYRRQSKRAYSAARLETAPSKNRVKLFFDQHGRLVLGLVDHHLDRACLPFTVPRTVWGTCPASSCGRQCTALALTPRAINQRWEERRHPDDGCLAGLNILQVENAGLSA